MAEWLYEEGIGENRAILIDDDHDWAAMSPGHGYAARGAAYPIIVEAVIERPGGVRAGAVLPARLTRILIPGRRGVAALDAGGEALIEPLPAQLTEGTAFRAEIIREAIPETGRAKLPKAQPVEAPPRPGPTLAERICAVGGCATAGKDRFEEAGWSDLLEQASTGEITFPGGSLRMSLTPAMTLFDVDGNLPPDALAEAGAAAAARAIRRFGLGGSIGIDLPTVTARGARQAAAAAVDRILPQPFERTAVNGFGFLQIVRRRTRASIPELVQGDPVGAHARALLRRAQQEAGGPLTLRAAPSVIERIAAHPEWTAALERRVGGRITLHPEPGLAISAGHVHRAQG